jgi:hypothetical protein
VGVVNRSQADINSRTAMAAARESERRFFLSRPEYASLHTGVPELVTTLTRLLERSIRAAVPSIQSHIQTSIRSLEGELRSAGSELSPDRGGRLHTALSLLEAFDRSFEGMLKGGRGGGERVRAVFERSLPQALQQLPFATMFSLRSVNECIQAADGFQPHLLAPELGMRRLIREGVSLLRSPAESIVDVVHSILGEIVSNAVADVAAKRPELGRFSALREALTATASAALESLREDARKMCVSLVSMEEVYFTASFFREAQSAMRTHQAEGAPSEEPGKAAGGPQLPRRPPPPPPVADPADSFPPELEAHLKGVSATVSAYVQQVCDGLKRSLPKACVLTQVSAAKKGLLSKLYQELGSLSDDQLKTLLCEDAGAVEQRRSVAQKLRLLRKAREDVNAALLSSPA